MLRFALLLCTLAGVAAVATVEEALPVPAQYKDVKLEEPLTKEEKPDPLKFPGVNQTETDAAFPGGRMPRKMEAWPKTEVTNAEGEKTMRPAKCELITILQDSSAGWENNCDGLVKYDGAKTEEECKAACHGDSLCPSWQFNNETACFIGEGTGCGAKRSGFPQAGGQRIQHGNVRVLMDMKTPGEGAKSFQVLGLKNIGKFQMPNGEFPTPEEGVEHCKHRCYANIECRFWQYSSDDGCWYNTAHLANLDEFTTADIDRTSDWLNNYIAGEYIQHYCKPEEPAIATPPAAEVVKEKPDLTWVWVVLGTVPILLALAGLAYYLTMKAPPKKRAVKVKAPAPEVEPLVEKLPTRYSTRTEMLPPIFVR